MAALARGQLLHPAAETAQPGELVRNRFEYWDLAAFRRPEGSAGALTITNQELHVAFALLQAAVSRSRNNDAQPLCRFGTSESASVRLQRLCDVHCGRKEFSTLKSFSNLSSATSNPSSS
jgi:hypothetical protein